MGEPRGTDETAGAALRTTTSGFFANTSTGTRALTTPLWSSATNLSDGAAAPYAALIVGIAAFPTYVLGRWFERPPSRVRA
ncbi:MAG: hypothetical protein ACLPVY_11450 [Acidimicrobiia bacterium]